MQRSEFDQWKASDVARLLALVESERRYFQDLFAALPVPLALVDATMTTVMANREFRRRFDRPAAEASRFSLRDLFSAQELEPSIAGLVKGELARATVRAIWAAPDGERPVRLLLQRHRGWEELGDEEVLVVVDEPGSEAASSVNWQQSPVASWTLDSASGHFTAVNEAARQLPLDGTAWGSLASRAGFVHPADRERWFRFYRENAQEPGSILQLDYAVSDGMGAQGWRRDVVRYLGGGQISGITLDTTADRRAFAREKADQKLEAVERLAGRIAHVANNLLMIVGGYAEELMLSLPDGDARRNDLQEILKASGRLATITGDLNRLVRPPKYRPEPIDLRHWMDLTLTQLESQLPGVEIQAGVGATPISLQANREVLSGLALEFARALRPVLADGSRLAFRGAALSDGEAVIWWTVQGPLPPRQWAERLLEPFSGPKEGGDPPLGLAAWIRPWQDLGGRLVVETEPEGQLLFLLTCPASSTAPATGPRILVAEDEPSIRSLVARALEREGYRVTEAETAQSALASMEADDEPYDLLVTDYNMPGMSGMQLAERAQTRHPELRVLLISGATEDPRTDDRIRGALPAGFSFLQKPFSPATLVERVRQILGGAAFQP